MAAWDLYEGSPPKWIFAIDTTDDAGGVEREMGCYVMGRCDDFGMTMERIKPYRQMYQDEVEGDPFDDLITWGIDDPGDDGIQRSTVTLVPTPGYSNNGMGEVVKLEPGQPMKHAAFNSIGFFLSREPTPAELELLTSRALKFETVPQFEPWDHRPKILGFRLVKYRTVIETPWSRDLQIVT